MAPKFVTLGEGAAAQEAFAHIRPGLTGVASESGPGVLGIGKDGDGVEGLSDSGSGVSGYSKSGPGLWGSSETGEAVHAETNSPLSHAVAAYHHGSLPSFPLHPIRAAIYGESKSAYAAYFTGKVGVSGDVSVTGNVTAHDVVLSGADCAEYFSTREEEPIEAGTVMVLDGTGSLKMSASAYDKRVAGIVSGAGDYKPGVILGHESRGKQAKPIALSGTVFCRADAQYGPIEVGDLLTTSETPGHAMKAADPYRAFGAVLGKAMGALQNGRGLVPVLVGLL